MMDTGALGKKTMSRRMLWRVALLSLGLALLFSSVQAWVTYRGELESVGNTLDEIRKTQARSITNALWDFNREQLAIQLEGLLNFAYISHVAVEYDGKTYAEAGVNTKEHVRTWSIPLAQTAHSGTFQLGHLHVTVDLAGIRKEAVAGIARNFLFMTMMVAVNSMVLFVLFERMVMRHITSIGEYFRKAASQPADLRLSLNRRPMDDELDTMVDAYNRLSQEREKAHARMHAALQEKEASEASFSLIFQMAPECITFVRLSDSVITMANAAFETITGHSARAAVGKDVYELDLWVRPEARQELLRQLKANGQVKVFEYLLRRKDGEERQVVASCQLVTVAGEQCYISVIHDITDQRKIQTMLIESEKMTSMGSLAAGIAHEINNPLGIVHQAVQNLILRTSPEQKKNREAAAAIGLDMDLLQQYLRSRKLDVFMRDIQDAALRASSIIRNMLNFSRRSESKRQLCDMRHIIEQAVFLASTDYDLKKSYDFKNIEIVKDMGAQPPLCRCTETEIEQVILNLLRNAAQAMATANPPTPNPRIDLRLRVVEQSVRIEVADNGPGMPPEIERRVFEPFFTTKPPGMGTGLGLSVSYFIITKGHSGRMWVTSEPGRGTSFFIELPVVREESANA
jgi:PAS domain S-box-containing protein